MTPASLIWCVRACEIPIGHDQRASLRPNSEFVITSPIAWDARLQAKLFFSELARKGGDKNPIYNILPDIVGRLSKSKDVRFT